MEELIIDADLTENKTRRRKLLPWWIKTFCWLFMLYGALILVCLILGIIGMQPNMAIYGFETTFPFSPSGLIIECVGILKGFTAYALWFEKDYAIKLGKVDALIGIALTLTTMLLIPIFSPGINFQFRLELLLLIPYLLRLNKIEKAWNSPVQ